MMASYPPGTRGPQGFNINQTSHICYVKSNKEWYVFFSPFSKLVCAVAMENMDL